HACRVAAWPVKAGDKSESDRCFTDNLSISRVRRGRWADQLWRESHGTVVPAWYLCWPDSQGREASRSSGPAVRQSYGCNYSQDRESAWIDRARQAADERCRSHRMNHQCPLLTQSGHQNGNAAQIIPPSFLWRGYT